MRTETPDEDGIYWVHRAKPDEWHLCFVDTYSERVTLFEANPREEVGTYEFDEVSKHLGKCEWFGPFACPGGVMGSHTVVADDELHRKARRKKQAVGIMHFDFQHCKNGHGSSITISGAFTREQADKIIKGQLPLPTAKTKAPKR